MFTHHLPFKKLEYITDASFDEIYDAIDGKIHRYSPINSSAVLKGFIDKEEIKLAVRDFADKRVGIDFMHPVFYGKIIEEERRSVISLKVRPSFLPIFRQFSILSLCGMFTFLTINFNFTIWFAVCLWVFPYIYYIRASRDFWELVPKSELIIEDALKPVQLTRRKSEDAGL